MVLKNWGPLTAKQKQVAISSAFDAVKDKVDISDLEKVKLAVYNHLLTIYKMNQAKFSSSDRFWSQANYEKHLSYLQGLADTEAEARAMAGTPTSSYRTTSNGAGQDTASYGNGNTGGLNMQTVLIVAVVAIVVIMLIKKSKKK